MDTIDAILTRRSVRDYTDEQVSETAIKTLLEAAMSAPSAGNQQPWQFIVINDRKLLDQIPNIHPYAKMLKKARLAILVCGDLEREKHKDFWVQDCSAATQNILIAARAIGLGAVWVGVHPREKRAEGIGELLKIPKQIIPFSLISIGCPAREQKAATRFDQKRIHYNYW